jgi:hypothetical protein
MIGARIAAGLLLTAGLLIPTLSAQAGDTFRLDIPGPAKDSSAQSLPDSDVHLAHYRGFHGGFYRGGYGGYRGGYYGGYRGGYYGGYRGYYGGYRGYAYYGGYRGYYGYPGYYGYASYYPSYYGGYYSGYYGGGYGYAPVYAYYGSSTFVTPCCDNPSPVVSVRITPVPGVVERVIETPRTTVPPTPPTTVPPEPGTTVPPTTTPPMPPVKDGVPPPMRVIPSEGTFPYDGGPRDPVPMPKLEDSPAGTSSSMVIRPDFRVVHYTEGKPLTKPAEKGKWVYPAYGEEAKRAPR